MRAKLSIFWHRILTTLELGVVVRVRVMTVWLITALDHIGSNLTKSD